MVALCPSCTASLYVRLGENPFYECASCGQRFSVKAINEEEDAIAVTTPIGVIRRKGTEYGKNPNTRTDQDP